MSDKIPMGVIRCTKHDYIAVTIGGIRVTPEKCCGTWDYVVRHWMVSAEDIERTTAEALEEQEAP